MFDWNVIIKFRRMKMTDRHNKISGSATVYLNIYRSSVTEVWKKSLTEIRIHYGAPFIYVNCLLNNGRP